MTRICSVGILDLQTGNLLYCNAGHNAPVHISDNVASFIDVKPNLPLGLFSGFPYEGQSMTLAKGDGFYIYTDGVTEAEDRSKELYSDEKLLELIRRCMTLRSKDIVEESFADLARHADGADQSDDITVLHFKYR